MQFLEVHVWGRDISYSREDVACGAMGQWVKPLPYPVRCLFETWLPHFQSNSLLMYLGEQQGRCIHVGGLE